MNDPWPLVLLSLALLQLAGLALLWWRTRPAPPFDPAVLRPAVEEQGREVRRVEESLRLELARQREESARAAATLREEVQAALRAGFTGVLERQQSAQTVAQQRLDAVRDTLEIRLREFGEGSDARLQRLRGELNDATVQGRVEMRQGFSEFQAAVRASVQDGVDRQQAQLGEFSARLERLTGALQTGMDAIRQRLEERLDQLQTRNDARLEEMRKTVDEKLEGTLERRLGESFKLVSERLEQVHKGLGEMQAMAGSVGDLKRVLTNVKTRGTWGEIQLGTLLAQVLAPDQFGINIAPRPGLSERVEFALRLPGPEPGGTPVWLPIDAKFPQEDYQRLVEAMDRGDAPAVNEAGAALEGRLRQQARDIRTKYVEPPHTTDFAILFLPSEGLYAEALRRPGLAEALQRDQRVVLAGPTTLAALLNSLQMGFRTLAIQQRSSEVWTVLGAVKTEFAKYGEVLGKVKRKLEEASHQIEQTEVRTRAIHRQLRSVEALPAAEAARLLPEGAADDEPPPPP